MRVNRGVLSEILGVSEAGLTTWADEGMPVRRDGRGTEWDADPAACVAWMVQRERDRIAATGPVSEQRARLLRAQADRADLEFRERAGELVRAEDVRRVTFGIWRTVRDAILACPDRLGPVLASEADPRRCSALLADELRTLLRAASDAAGADVAKNDHPDAETPP